MTATPFNIPELLTSIVSNGNDLSDRPEARWRCLAAARSLCYALETPLEAMQRLLYADVAHQASIRTCLELGVFEVLNDGNEKSVHTSQLSQATGADPQLLARLLKHLAAMGTIYEADVDLFLPTPLSTALTQPMNSDGFRVMQYIADPPTQKLHEYLAATHYQFPTDSLDCAFQLAHNTKSSFFEFLQQHPRLGSMFNNHMTSMRAGLSGWMDHGFYPSEHHLLNGISEEEDAVLLVDVGGGKGHDLQRICQQHPDIHNRLVLQDQANVIEDLGDTKLDSRITPMIHDFFQEQPIRGARAYYMHRILHDWPDNKCLEILKNLASAMIKGYSKLLVYDFVIPDKGAQGNSTGLDITMMSLFGSSERTEQAWNTLLESAGLKIVKIWPVEPASESLIEAELL